MKQGIFIVVENKALTGKVSRLVLKGDVSAIERPGQFVQLRLDGLYLRRPFSVCDRDENSLTVLFETVGKGTAKLRDIQPGAKLDALLYTGDCAAAYAAAFATAGLLLSDVMMTLMLLFLRRTLSCCP